LISGYISKKAERVYLRLNKIVQEIAALSNSIQWIEQQTFRADLLKGLQQQYSDGVWKASRQVKVLKEILDRFDYRLNPVVFIPLNTFFFWDLQQVLALEKWKEKNKQYVPEWFEALG